MPASVHVPSRSSVRLLRLHTHVAMEEVRIETTMGAFTVELYPQQAPRTCKNFLELCARLVGVRVLLGVAYIGACVDDATAEVRALLTTGSPSIGADKAMRTMPTCRRLCPGRWKPSCQEPLALCRLLYLLYRSKPAAT